MTPPASDVRALIARLNEEDELAGPAAVASNVAFHYDRAAGALMRSGDLQVVGELLKLVRDDRKVHRAEPPYLPLDGGYGKTFGPITVGDKARFMLERMLAPELFREAIAKGPAWLDANRTRLQWDEKGRRFVPRTPGVK